MEVQHASATWENYIPKKVNTLVLGSFNPNNPLNNTDYFYGRSSNYFWKVIADILEFNEDHFCGNYERKIEIMEKYGFCFYDLISSINIFGINENHENDFKQIKIFADYSDGVLFTSNTQFHDNNINLNRIYNIEILNFINNYKPNKIIHTLGNTRINNNFHSRPVELQNFINQILAISEQSNAIFNPISYSPSGRAVRVGGINYYQNLKNWLQDNLEL